MFVIIAALVIPWLIAILHLNSKNKKLIPLIAPMTSAAAFLINELWFHFNFGEVYPFPDQKTLSALPFNIGLYPVVGCYLIFFIRRNERPYLTVVLMSSVITLAEFIFLLMGGVTYTNGWNIFWTWIAYFAVFIFLYSFYLYLKKLKVIA
ncbi:hypothetical protein M3221_24360 [Domibacillus indicus]|uniref:hypothetical protein n=1 Tax=Domibacillus indicus TaxID=1437523 RepID=UPI00203EC126|nr:hypothetical protein [Domibacillus indicus]MCM3791461.1 hypothetical protein [Domibacillus indicus]